jgi:hypothetical protein
MVGKDIRVFVFTNLRNRLIVFHPHVRNHFRKREGPEMGHVSTCICYQLSSVNIADSTGIDRGIHGHCV